MPRKFSIIDDTQADALLSAPVSRPIHEDEIEAYGALLGRCFLKEPWNEAFVAVLEDPRSRESFLHYSSLSDVREFAEKGYVYVIDDLKGLVLGFTSEMISPEGFERIEELWFTQGCEHLVPYERELLTKRLEILQQGEGGHGWMNERFPDGYNFIYGICVDPRHRGQGVFGALIDPLIASCTEQGKPLCLDTFSERLVSIYEYKGFKLLDTVESHDIDPPMPPHRQMALFR